MRFFLVIQVYFFIFYNNILFYLTILSTFSSYTFTPFNAHDGKWILIQRRIQIFFIIMSPGKEAKVVE